MFITSVLSLVKSGRFIELLFEEVLVNPNNLANSNKKKFRNFTEVILKFLVLLGQNSK